MYGEQSRFKDKIVHVVESEYQKLVVTTWLEKHWLFINGNLQMTTLDEYLYHEPMIHPVMSLLEDPKNILIIGGGDGFNAKELLKYEAIETIELVDLDPEMTKLGAAFAPFVRANQGSLSHHKLTVLNEDGFVFLQESNSFYDLIVIDLPDAKGVDLSKLYSKEFYQMIKLHLRPNGYMVTQSGNPYLATRAFECIKKTMQNVGFNIAPIHNHVLSMGEWSWVIGSKDLTSTQLKSRLEQGTYSDIETRWLNQESVKMMLNFGKPLEDTAGVEVNTINNPVLYQYQLNGNWGHY
jgi:spermidine synthase